MPNYSYIPVPTVLQGQKYTLNNNYWFGTSAGRNITNFGQLMSDWQFWYAFSQAGQGGDTLNAEWEKYRYPGYPGAPNASMPAPWNQNFVWGSNYMALQAVLQDGSSGGGGGLYQYGITSGAIVRNIGGMLYGYYEMNAQFPNGGAGSTMWPAFWYVPYPYSWPSEEDILEGFVNNASPGVGNISGSGYSSNAYFTEMMATNTFHTSSGFSQTQTYANTALGSTGGLWYGGNVDYSQDYHKFAVLMLQGGAATGNNPVQITAYVDDVRVQSIDCNWVNASGGTPQGVILMANLAVGDSNLFGGGPRSTSWFPDQFKIDFIRYWQPNSSAPILGTVYGQPPTSPGIPGRGINTVIIS